MHLSPPKKKDGISRPFSLVKMRGREALCKPQARKESGTFQRPTGAESGLPSPSEGWGVGSDSPYLHQTKKGGIYRPFLFCENTADKNFCSSCMTSHKLSFFSDHRERRATCCRACSAGFRLLLSPAQSHLPQTATHPSKPVYPPQSPQSMRTLSKPPYLAQNARTPLLATPACSKLASSWKDYTRLKIPSPFPALATLDLTKTGNLVFSDSILPGKREHRHSQSILAMPVFF